MKDKIKFLIIIVIVIIIILIGLILYLNKIYDEKKQNEYKYDEPELYESKVTDVIVFDKIGETTEKEEFFDTQTCVDIYVNTLLRLDKNFYLDNMETANTAINAYREQLYSMLDKEYINYYKVTLDNIDSKLSNYYSNLSFQIENMYQIDNLKESKSVFFVYGNLLDISKNTIQKYGFIVKRDGARNFTIIPYEYMTENGYSEENIKNANASKLMAGEIANNTYNTYTSTAFDYEYISQYYFRRYKNYLRYNYEEIYNKMELEYKQKRFPTLENFKNYLAKNFNILLTSAITQYSVVEKENYKDYVCIDQLGNCYIFRESSINNYKIMLDDYTLENEYFNEAYEKVSNKEKGLLNCQKFFKMVNMQDYKSAYKLLDENFKQTYFKTQAEFESYIKNKLFQYNKATYKGYGNVTSNIHTFKVNLTDATEQKTNTVEFNIVMQLLEGTNFTMSFEVN